MPKMIDYPKLDIDAWFAERGRVLSPSQKAERRIVFALCQYLGEHGFPVIAVDDGYERTRVEDTKSAMELVFNLEMSHLIVKGRHSVLLVCGNGEDIISDWSYSEGDSDGFNACMNAFCKKLDEVF